MIVSEDYLMKDSCVPKSFRNAIETSTNLITTLRPYIQGHVNLKAASLSPIKPPIKKSAVQSRPQKKKVMRISDSESSSLTEDDEARPTPGAKHAFCVLSSEKNKIRREIIHRKLVRKGQVSNLQITHIHRPPLD